MDTKNCDDVACCGKLNLLLSRINFQQYYFFAEVACWQSAGEPVMLISFLPLAAAFVAFLCSALIICRAHKWDLVDSPNHQSSHISPTPRGGGIGLVLAGSFAGLYILLTQKPSFQNSVVLGTSCVLAAVGLLDDLKPRSAAWRLTIQTFMAANLRLGLGGESEQQRLADV